MYIYNQNQVLSKNLQNIHQNQLYINIHNCYLTKHEIIKVENNSLSKVTYTNKTNTSQEIVLLVNVSNKVLNYNGIETPAYGYIKAN